MSHPDPRSMPTLCTMLIYPTAVAKRCTDIPVHGEQLSALCIHSYQSQSQHQSHTSPSAALSRLLHATWAHCVTPCYTQHICTQLQRRVSHFFLWESHFYGSVVLTSSHEKCETRKQEFSENSNIEFYASQFYLFGWRNSSKWAELA